MAPKSVAAAAAVPEGGADEPPDQAAKAQQQQRQQQSQGIAVPMKEKLGDNMVSFKDICLYYANMIDYGRFLLCCIGAFSVCGDWNPWITGFLLYTSFILDIYDGKVARYFNQCSLVGDGFDWSCDLFVDLLFALWWGRLEPVLQPFLLIVWALEAACALFDFAIYSHGRHPPRGVQTGFCVILQWMTPHNKWTSFGWNVWMSYPPFVVARCLWLSGWSLFGLLALAQLVLFVPGMCYLWWNVALLFGNLGIWTEPDQNKKGGAEPAPMVAFQQIRFYYANLLDYGRFLLCCIATFGIYGDWNPWVTGGLLYVSFMLDIYDGKVARHFKQCSLLGDGLDWSCDLFVDLLFALWWGRLEPALMPLLLIVYALEVSCALFDFSIHSSGRFPPRGVQTGFCVILQWMTPHNKWTSFGWYAWMSYPPFAVARCLWLSGWSLYGLLALAQLVLFVPAMCYLWWNVALLFGNLGIWTEPDRNKKSDSNGSKAVENGAASIEWLTFKQIRFYYGNLIDYARFLLCCIATFGVCGDWNPYITGFVLYTSFFLDIYDGKAARYFNQCCLLGDGLDWACDLFVDLLFALWWGRLEPALQPFLLIVFALEAAAALFDFSIYSSGRYPPREKQTGFCVILQWMTPHNKWTDFGWYTWMSYPPFVIARCLWLQGRTLFGLALLVQVLLFVPAMCYLWWNVALLFGNLERWTEMDQNRKKKVVCE